MRKNLHVIDRVLRFLLAVVVAVLYFTNAINATAAIVLGLVAVLLIVTSFTGFCPVYHVLGISTLKKKSGK